MSNSSKVSILGAEYTRFLAICENASFYFSDKIDDGAIAKALAHFPDGKVFLGFPDEPLSFHDISDLREIAGEVLPEPGEWKPIVNNVVKHKTGRIPPRHSAHSKRQAIYFETSGAFKRV